jgi:hypothetical protein
MMAVRVGCWGDGGVDGDCFSSWAVKQLDAEGVIDLAAEPGGQLGHQVAQDRELIQQVSVRAGWRSRFQGS